MVACERFADRLGGPMSLKPLPKHPGSSRKGPSIFDPGGARRGNLPNMRGAHNRSARSSQERRATIAAQGTPVRLIYGRQQLGAAIAAATVYQNKLTLLCGWGLGRIEAIESVRIDGQEPGAGVVLTDYLGVPGQGVDPTLAAAISGYTDTLEVTRGGVTLAAAYSVIRVPPEASSGFPRIEATCKGLRIFDPRDPDQVLGDSSTWVYSANPALACADLIASPFYGRGQSVDWDSVAIAADACDELLADGSPRRELHMVLDRVLPVDEWVAVLADYAGCYVVSVGGLVRLVPDRPAVPVRAIGPGDYVAGSDRPRLRGGVDAPTVVRVDYTRTDSEQWRDAPVYAVHPKVNTGEWPWREARFSMPGIVKAAQAQRVATEKLNAAHLRDLDVEWIGFDEHLELLRGSVVEFTSPWGLTAKLLRIMEVAEDAPGRWRCLAEEYDPAVYSDEVVVDPTSPDTDLPSPLDIPAPTDITADSGDAQLIRGADGGIISRILVAWQHAPWPYRVQFLVRYRRVTDTDWTELSTSGSATYLAPVQDAVEYEVAVSAVTANVQSPWATSTHLVVGKTAPPPVPVGFTVARQPDGTREFAWDPGAQPLDFKGVRIRYVAGEVYDWAAMAPLHDGTLEVSPWETNQLAAGLYTFALVAADTSGNVSDPIYILAELDNPRLANVLVTEQCGPAWPGDIEGAWKDGPVLRAVDTGLWDGLSAVTWDDWLAWARVPQSPIRYTHPAIDLGGALTFTPLVTAEASGGTAVVEYRVLESSGPLTVDRTDITVDSTIITVDQTVLNAAWSDWAVPAGPVQAQVVQVRVTVTGADPLLSQLSIVLDGRVVEEALEDLNTATLDGANRIGVGDIRLPLTETFGLVRSVQLALQNVGAGWSWEVVDKSTAGPRVRIYDSTNSPADAVIDALIRGA